MLMVYLHQSFVGVVSSFVGTGIAQSVDGVGTSACLSFPVGVAFDANGLMYVGEQNGFKIRTITTSGLPQSIFSIHNSLSNILKSIIVLGVVSTLAGSSQGYADGQGTNAKFLSPSFIFVETSAAVLYVSDGNAVRKVALPLCSPGYYYSTSSGCTAAPVGYYAVSSMLYACAAGSWSSVVGSSVCVLCPVGTYSSSAASSSCQLAPIGECI